MVAAPTQAGIPATRPRSQPSYPIYHDRAKPRTARRPPAVRPPVSIRGGRARLPTSALLSRPSWIGRRAPRFGPTTAVRRLRATRVPAAPPRCMNPGQGHPRKLDGRTTLRLQRATLASVVAASPVRRARTLSAQIQRLLLTTSRARVPASELPSILRDRPRVSRRRRSPDCSAPTLRRTDRSKRRSTPIGLAVRARAHASRIRVYRHPGNRLLVRKSPFGPGSRRRRIPGGTPMSRGRRGRSEICESEVRLSRRRISPRRFSTAETCAIRIGLLLAKVSRFSRRRHIFRLQRFRP